MEIDFVHGFYGERGKDPKKISVFFREVRVFCVLNSP